MTAVTALVAAAAHVPSDVPVDPTAPDAQQLLLNELSKPEYIAAKPTWFDQLAASIGDWLNSLTVPSGPNLGGLVPVIVTVIVVALIVVAFIVFGRPRINRRGDARPEALFGSDDRRSSAELRASAAAAAAAGDYATAIEELFRSIARRQAERTVLRVSPGTTAQDFAGRAGHAYPDQADLLRSAASDFDRVRYLGSTGTREQYDRMLGLEAALRDRVPAARESAGAGGASAGAGAGRAGTGTDAVDAPVGADAASGRLR